MGFLREFTFVLASVIALTSGQDKYQTRDVPSLRQQIGQLTKDVKVIIDQNVRPAFKNPDIPISPSNPNEEVKTPILIGGNPNIRPGSDIPISPSNPTEDRTISPILIPNKKPPANSDVQFPIIRPVETKIITNEGCTRQFDPVCAVVQRSSYVTFGNICSFELEQQKNPEIKMVKTGAC